MSPAWFTSSSLWLHLATFLLFVLGFILTLRNAPPMEHGIQRLIPLGRTFFAVPLLLFGLQHFVFLNEVKGAVPSWMPWHIFWACLVGAALIAASVSMVAEIEAGLAALLTGVMLLLFVLLIYLPNLVLNPHDPLAIEGPCRDLAMSGGALAFAGTQGGWKSKPISWLKSIGRWFFAIPMIYFGAEHFLHPEFAPGVPLQILMPSWMPGHLAWAYGMGTVLVACGLCVLADRFAYIAAVCLGIAFLGLVVLLYLPMEVIHPSIEISGELDNVAEKLAMSGAALFIAGATAKGAQARGVSARLYSSKDSISKDLISKD